MTDTPTTMPTTMSTTALITGSTDGIGVTTARNMMIHGTSNSKQQKKNHNNNVNNVLIHGRDNERIRIATESLLAGINNNDNKNNSNNDSNCSSSSNNNYNSPSIAIPLPASDLSTIKGCYDLVKDVKQLLCNDSSATTGTTNTNTNTSTNEGLNLKILVNNAGVYSRKLMHTPDGLESTFAVNVLAPFIVTSMLLSSLLTTNNNESSSNNNDKNNSSSSRIVIASSVSQSQNLPKNYWDDPQYLNNKRSYSAHGAYSESKLLVAMLSMEMAHRLKHNNNGAGAGAGAGIDSSILTCNCLDPGTVNTKMLLDGWGKIGIDVDDAMDETWCCTSTELEGISGKYFVGQTSRKASDDAYNPIQRDKLWHYLSKLAPEAAEEWDRVVDLYSTNKK